MIKTTLCLILAILLSGCSNSKIYKYDNSEPKELFLEHFTQFEDVRMLLSQSEYNQLSIWIEQWSDGKYHWTIPAISGSDEVDQSTLNQTVVAGAEDFCEITKCRSIRYFCAGETNELEIRFLEKNSSNAGIAYLPDGPDEIGAKFYEELSDGWYYFSFPAV